MAIDWTQHLLEQLTWHWDSFVRPHLDGLTDDEHLWEPVPGCWSVRRRGDGWFVERTDPAPQPPPVTTIAWRLAHLVGVFAARTANHFGGPTFSYDTFPWPGSADGALAALDTAYSGWVTGVRGLGPRELLEPVGPSEGPSAEAPYADLVLHITREALHHSAEVLVLRDLYRAGLR
jgi:hypothetical protein